MVTHQAVWHAVAHGIDIDEGVGSDPAPQTLLATRQGPDGQGPERRALVPVKAHARRFARRPVPSLVGGRGQPFAQVPFEGGEGLEGLAGQGIPLDVFDARLGLTLGPGPIRRARAWLDVPVATEGQIRRMEDHRARRPVPRPHQRARVVPEDRARHAAEVAEGGREAFAPVRAPLIEKRFDEQAPRIAEDGHEQEDAHPHPGDQQRLLAEVDLQLVAGRRLDPDGRERRGALRSSNVRDRSLKRPHADRAAVLG